MKELNKNQIFITVNNIKDNFVSTKSIPDFSSRWKVCWTANQLKNRYGSL